ncbi:hypothetical protein LTR70_010577 [Exophiala xenobiotica]|uniref:GPI inositol-deacylase n=1 Tax=Lithohypha guttulata TaxID=1690604 RepID=A0ABR0JTU4_9EURO|nr:hypothetical protein LTR24_010539 [Lithohypha guttulata]KAK5309138.1 hypothetical protein LTR70_010577 [Exophiala xenobiotica]
MLGRLRRHRIASEPENDLLRPLSREPEHNVSDDAVRNNSIAVQRHASTARSAISSYDIVVRGARPEHAAHRIQERSRERRLDPLGLTVLYEPDDNHVVDIVFVHGLGGTSRQSWSANRDPDLFWPLEWLPHETGISNARISTFGYNAHFASAAAPNSILNISDFAKDLLFQLRFAAGKEKKQLDVGRTPIIFVAHSMGGLVVKKAFILGQNDQYYKDIVKAISAMVFLSTPHRGANLADVLNKILSACLPTVSPKQYVGELKLNSPTILEINEQFRHLAPSIDIVSFFETQATAIGPTNALVVQRDSSTLGYPGEISKALNADHHGVSKYLNRQDPNYASVRDILKFLIEKIPMQLVEPVHGAEVDELRLVSDFLGNPEPPTDDKDFFMDKRLEGSGEWFLNDVTLSAWLESDSSSPQLLWCTGKPGSGKSVLTSYFVEQLQDKGVVLAFHFFRFGDQVKNNLATFMLSTALQLARAIPEFKRRLLRMQSDDVNVQKSAPRHLWQKLFHTALFKLSSTRPIFIILDALDEMENASLLLKLFADVADSHLPFRILFVSRPTGSLRSSMKRLAERNNFKQINIDRNQEDLRLYIQEELYDMQATPTFKQQVVERLMRSADGNFLWVYLVVNEILKCHTEDSVEEALHQIPADLEELYQRMDNSLALSSSYKDVALGRLVLTWAACSRYPLTLTELAGALEPEYSKVLDLRHTAQQVCGDFITFDHKAHLAMIHSSARECLLSIPTFHYHIQALRAHQALFAKCLQALVRWSPKERVGAVRGDSFAYYAMTSWPFHLELTASWSDQESLSLLFRFFSSGSVQHWIYLLCIAGKLRILVQAAKVMTTFLKTSDKLDKERSPLTHKLHEKEVLHRWSQDLVRIVGKFGAQLQQHPRAIYKFIPALCPSQSILRSQFCDTRTSNGLELRGNLAPSWDDCLARFSMAGDTMPLDIITIDRHFAIVLADGTVRMYYSGTCDEARSFLHGERILVTCFTADGDVMATYGFLKTKIWDTRTARLICSFPNPQKAKALAMSFDEESQLLLTCSDDRLIRYCSMQVPQDGWVALPEPLGTGPKQHQHANSPRRARFNADGSLLAVSYRGLHPSVWSITESGPEFIRYCERGSYRAAGKSSVQTNMTDAQDLCWNPLTGHLLGVFNDGCIFKWHPYEDDYDFSAIQATSIEASDDGKFFVTSSSNGTLRVWDFQHFTPIYQLTYASDVTGLAIDKNECRIYDLRDKFCNVWEPNALFRLLESDDKGSDNLSTQESSTHVSSLSEATVENAEPVTTLALDLKSGQYVVGDDSGMVCIFDELGDRVAELADRFMTVDQACWSGDGSCIASSDLSRTVMVEQLVANGNGQRQELSVSTLFVVNEDAAIRQVLMDEEGTFLLVATTNAVHLWSIEDRRQTRSIPDQQRSYWCTSPHDQSTLIGFSTEMLKIARWTDDLDLRVCKIVRQEQRPSEPREEFQRRPSRAYPMLPEEIEGMVDKVIISQDGELALTQSSQTTPQGRREKIFALMDLSTVPSADDIEAYPLHPDLEGHVEVLLGFLSHEQVHARSRRRSSAHMPSMSGMFEQGRTSYGHVLVFVSKDFWVCTFDFGAGSSACMARHFFLPRDWWNLELLELATVTRQGDILCPKNGQVAIIANGLCEEWAE